MGAAEDSEGLGEVVGGLLGSTIDEPFAEPEEDADRGGGERACGEAVGQGACVRGDCLGDGCLGAAEPFAFAAAQVGVGG